MSKPSNSPKKIVLADDSVTMHRAVKLGLKKEPFDVICCDNGADAWRIVKMEKPDAVLADLDMPGMTGAELCQKIKNDPQLKHIPVILVCGSFDQVDEKHLETVPSDARLWKPFETHVLTSLLSKVLGNNQGASGIRESAEPTAFETKKPVAPPPPSAKSRGQNESEKSSSEFTASNFEPTISQHIAEPDVSIRGQEIPEVSEPTSLLDGFQDLPFGDGESTGQSFDNSDFDSPLISNEPTQQQTAYENLWTSDPVSTPAATATEATQAMSSPTPAAPTTQSDWGSFETMEKTFSNEVFEAVESRNFENEIDEDLSSASEATEMIPSNLRDNIEATQALPNDLQGYREETSQAFAPQQPIRNNKATTPTSAMPRTPSATQPIPQPSHVTNSNNMPTAAIQRSSIVEHTAPLSSHLMSQQQKPGLSEDEVRKIIREEIQTAISGWLKNRLHEELDRVIEEIDRE